MDKEVIDSILLANFYLISCKINNGNNCQKSDLARKYLVSKIKKALIDRKKFQSKRPSSYFNFLFN